MRFRKILYNIVVLRVVNVKEFWIIDIVENQHLLSISFDWKLLFHDCNNLINILFLCNRS